MPTASQLAPDLNKSDYYASNKMLTVGEVKGTEQKDLLGIETISVGSDVVKDALINTMQSSGIFKDVSANSGGDYVLSAQIISQKLEGGMSNTLTLMIRYRLIDSISGKNIWAGNIFSEKSLSVTDVFTGAERLKQLRQMTFHDNFSKLAIELNKAIRQNQPMP